MLQIGKLEEYISFVNTIWLIKLIDELVNKPVLESNFEEVIKAFEESYKILQDTFNISITNKVHIIIDHLEDYMGTSTECSEAATVTL